MSGKEPKLSQSLARLLEIPSDLAFDLPRIIMQGNLEISIENHSGLVEFSPERIVVGTGRGQLEISGEDLRVKSILIYEIVIEGRISAVRFV
ncbi:MAG: sporulation protein YqfC [Firmicutes bacterium]|nr:sporulation protein YqfC [Bacillota bacterium]